MVEHIHLSKYGPTNIGYQLGALNSGLPKFQGEYPHLSISIWAFNDILMSSIYETLEVSERFIFAIEVQKTICDRHGVKWNKTEFLILNYIQQYLENPSSSLLSKIHELQKDIVDSVIIEEMNELINLYLSEVETAKVLAIGSALGFLFRKGDF